MINLEELSKEVSYALRHAHWEYELEMDEEGWVSVEQFVDALKRDKKWEGISEDDLSVMIDKSQKKRHEICCSKIRAFYGHSIPMHIIKEKQTPLDILYHGTVRRYLSNIEINGLIPKSRQYVHLSQDIITAQSVGLRHDNKPCILKINAKKAWEDGIDILEKHRAQRMYYGKARHHHSWLEAGKAQESILVLTIIYRKGF